MVRFEPGGRKSTNLTRSDRFHRMAALGSFCLLVRWHGSNSCYFSTLNIRGKHFIKGKGFWKRNSIFKRKSAWLCQFCRIFWGLGPTNLRSPFSPGSTWSDPRDSPDASRLHSSNKDVLSDSIPKLKIESEITSGKKMSQIIFSWSPWRSRRRVSTKHFSKLPLFQ